MSRKAHHVVPSPTGGWEVKRSGSKKVDLRTDSKQEAIDAGRKISRNEGTEFVIHGKDGQILHNSSVRSSVRKNKIREVIRSVNSDPSFKDSKTRSEK
jgi:hypothetical protein